MFSQQVLLQIRPRTGDTLSVRLDQRVEMSGGGRTMTTVTEVFSRAIVQRSSRSGSTVLAVTDSIRASTSTGPNVPLPVRVPGSDNSIKLRVSTDGGAEVLESESSDQMRALFGQMPAVLARESVSVGEKWKREMQIPIVGEPGSMGRVRATIQLDSLSESGNIAYLSMHGTLSHDHRDGSSSGLDGSMTGFMQLDRRLGWIVQTRGTIDVTSMVRGSKGAPPMRVRTKVTQLLRASSAR
jgi:hypothetical protein